MSPRVARDPLIARLVIRQPERDLQEAVVARLRHLGYRVYEFAKPGAHRRLGGIVPPGWTDLVIIHRLPGGPVSLPGVRPGCTVAMAGAPHTYLELKTTGGKLSPAERDHHAELTALGCYVATAWTFDAAIECIEKRQRALEERA